MPTHTAECRIQTTSHQGNRPDVTVFDKQAREILVVEFSCPWVTNRIKKDEEKTAKFREELKACIPNYTLKRINVIMDVLGGMSLTLGKQLTAELVHRRQSAQSDQCKRLSLPTVCGSITCSKCNQREHTLNCRMLKSP